MSRATRDDRLFKALSDARRRRILDLLKSQPRTTGELCERFAGSLDRCTVLQHIAVLERAELVVARREGRTRWNYLNAAPFKDIYDRWISSYAVNAIEMMARLKLNLEGEEQDS
jgi:DNA-binding transcriptional ArsR family regulator